MNAKKLIALALALCLALSLAACGLGGEVDLAGGKNDPDSQAGQTGQTGQTPDFAVDYAAAYETWPADAVVFTVNGEAVTWDVYYYWLYNIASQIEAYYGPVSDWDAAGLFDDETTYNQYVADMARDMAAEYVVIRGMAAEQGITLTEDDRAQLEALRQSDADTYADGDLDGLREYLKMAYLSEDYYNCINETALLYQRLFASLYGENGAQLSDEEASAFIESGGYLRAKHVLLMTVDEDGAPIPEAEKAEKLAQAKQIASELRAAPHPETAVDEFIRQYNEDPGMEVYTDGYVFGPGQMVQAFYDAAQALGENEVSEPVESSYGYHVIVRLPISPDMTPLDSTQTLRTMAAASQFSTVVTGWLDSAEIVWQDDFEGFTPGGLFGPLTDLSKTAKSEN